MTVKEQILKAMSELLEDADYQDAMERLYVFFKIEQGIAQLDSGQKFMHQEVKRRLAKCLP